MLKTSLACLKISRGDECSLHVSLLMARHKIFSLLKMSLVARDANKAGPHWETRGGAHARRGVHGILGLTMGVCVSWCLVNLHSCTWWWWPKLGSAGPDFEAGGGVQSLRGVYSIIGMTIGNVCGEPAPVALATSNNDGTCWAASGMVRTLAGECTASLGCTWVCVKVRWTSTVAFYISDGDATDWEARGWCAHS